MDRSQSHRGPLVYAGQLTALAVAYVALGAVGLSLSPINVFAALLWPPTGLSLAALALGGLRLWPAVTVGALLVNLGAGAPPLVALGIAAGNTAEALVGSWALRRIPGFQGRLDRVADVVGLAIPAAMLSTLISAGLGVLSLSLGGLLSGVSVARTGLAWWTGDVMSDLILAPALLAWWAPSRAPRRRRGVAEGLALTAVMAACSAVVFFQPPEIAWDVPILLPYVAFLPLIGGALRLGTGGAAASLLVAAALAIAGTYTGHGAFAHADRIEALIGLHVFLALSSLTALAVGAMVAERERSRLAARESEERLRLAIDAAGLGTWCWDPAHDRLEWSALCKRMYGLGDDAEVSYARLLAQLHPDDCERTERAVARSLEERADYRIEHRVVRPDGAERWLSVLGRPYCDAAGGVRRMLGVAMDVTEQKALLGREQAARAEAQAATQAKDEFLAVLSHELRTPLQAMLGWTHMLRAPGLDAERTCKALETIERNVMAQERLIEDLLDVSRIVAGKLRLASQPVELADVLTSALESLGAEAGAKSIRVEAMIAASAVVLGDRDRLRQVVANLLTNAVKFTPRGGRIAVRLLREGPVAKVVVEDSGCGISAAFLPHVFERFRQAESAYARPHGGLGLGLAIVFHIVALHGGTVRAKSPGEGLGATFTITLPLVGAATAERGDASPARPEGRFAIEGVRVLVVDDDTDARELFEVALRASGAEVRSVGSAAAALVELDSFAAHLLVSDIGMPGEDGYALLRRLRAREPPGGAHLPAIALTAFAGPTDRAQAIDAGFEVHLAKPVTPSALVEEVAKLAGRSRRALSAAG